MKENAPNYLIKLIPQTKRTIRTRTIIYQDITFKIEWICFFFFSLAIEDRSHYLLHFHHFNHQCIDLMSSVKYVCHNFESMFDYNKKDVLIWWLFSHFDENKNKFMLEVTVNYIKNSERFSGSYEWNKSKIYQITPTLNSV